MKWMSEALGNVWGLLVDDGAVAIGGLVAVVLTGVVSRAAGPSLAWGLLLFGLTWCGMAVSLRRAVRSALWQEDQGQLPEPATRAPADRPT